MIHCYLKFLLHSIVMLVKNSLFLLCIILLITTCTNEKANIIIVGQAFANCEKLYEPRIINFSKHFNSCLDMETSLVESNKKNKSILVLFNSIACVNCIRFEDFILKQDSLIRKINDKFVFANLYVDVYCPLKNPIKARAPHKTILKTLGSLNWYYQYKYSGMGGNPVVVILKDRGEKAVLYRGNLFDSHELTRWLEQN